MYLYKSKIFVDGIKLTKEKIIEAKHEREVYHNQLYLFNKIEHIGNYSLFWYFRDTHVFSENGIYYKVENNKKIEINPNDEEYKSMQREYNYYVIFDFINSYMYTINTTDDSSTINKDLIKKFFNFKKIEILNELNMNEVIQQIDCESMRIMHTRKVQRNLFNESNYEELINKAIYDVFGGNNVKIDFKIENNRLFRTTGIPAINKLITDGIRFYITGHDDNENRVKITNDKTVKSIKIGDFDHNDMHPLEIYNELREGLKNEVL